MSCQKILTKNLCPLHIFSPALCIVYITGKRCCRKRRFIFLSDLVYVVTNSRFTNETGNLNFE